MIYQSHDIMRFDTEEKRSNVFDIITNDSLGLDSRLWSS